jgi:hypothetical protein
MIATVTDTDIEAQSTDDDWQPGDPAPVAPPATTAATVDNELPENRYLNRELSWLDFNSRVLALAADTSLPLLERAKFLAIFASNLLATRAEHPNTQAWGRRKDVKVFGCSDDCARCGTANVDRMPTNA